MSTLKRGTNPHPTAWTMTFTWTAKNTTWILMIYRLELRKNGSILKLNTQRMPNNITRNINKKKQLCLPQIKDLVHWYDFAHSHYSVASGSVLSLIFLQTIVCLWNRPRRAARGRSPVHLWVGSFIHAAGFGWTCASTLKFTLSLVESVTLLMVTHESNRIAQWPVVSDGSKG